MRAAAAARLSATKGGTPTRTGQSVVNDNTQSANGRGGQAPWEGASQEEEGRQDSTEGATDASGKAGRPE